MKKRIGLITVHKSSNYGAFLQAYATKSYLSNFGIVKTIDYKNDYLESSLELIRPGKGLKGLLGRVKDVLRYFPRKRVIKSTLDACESMLDLTPRLGKSDLHEYAQRNFDILVSGSDQIWNPRCVNEEELIDDAYFLNFGLQTTKRISYSSSMGAHEYSESEVALVKKLLSKYDNLSVRESETAGYIQGLLMKRVYHVVDPTLLLTSEQWLDSFPACSKRVTRLIGQEYILFYSVPKSKNTLRALKFLKTNMRLPIVSVDQDIYPVYACDKKLMDASLSEFIHLFKNAKFVVTDSFHGVCFSLIFRRQFYAISPGRLANRISSLLMAIGLQSRLIDSADDIDFSAPINYDNHISALNGFIKESQEYLLDSLR